MTLLPFHDKDGLRKLIKILIHVKMRHFSQGVGYAVRDDSKFAGTRQKSISMLRIKS